MTSPTNIREARALANDLRHAEQNWQAHAAYDNWPGGNPWADLRDAWAARHDRIKAQIAELSTKELTQCI